MRDLLVINPIECLENNYTSTKIGKLLQNFKEYDHYWIIQNSLQGFDEEYRDRGISNIIRDAYKHNPSEFFFETMQNPHIKNCLIDESFIEKLDETGGTIEICGYYTDRSILATALLIHDRLPQWRVIIKANCCSASNYSLQESALKIAKSNGIEIDYN